MNTNNNIAEEVKSTFESIDHIQDIKTSPFFKDKTMRKLFDAEVEEDKIVFFLVYTKASISFFSLCDCFKYFCLYSIKIHDL